VSYISYPLTLTIPLNLIIIIQNFLHVHIKKKNFNVIVLQPDLQMKTSQMEVFGDFLRF